MPFGQGWRREFIANGLTDDKPAGLVHKAREYSLSVLPFAVLRFFLSSLAGDRHAKSQSTFFAFDGATQLLPEKCRLDQVKDRAMALHDREDLITDRVVTKWRTAMEPA